MVVPKLETGQWSWENRTLQAEHYKVFACGCHNPKRRWYLCHKRWIYSIGHGFKEECAVARNNNFCRLLQKTTAQVRVCFSFLILQECWLQRISRPFRWSCVRGVYKFLVTQDNGIKCKTHFMTSFISVFLSYAPCMQWEFNAACPNSNKKHWITNAMLKCAAWD